jgi:AcrR family transcriptional regulator
VPTGVAIHHPREQLFDAAERVLLRAGASALTSRAVTTEAGCAKGVLHRHFADFDTFLAELVRDRIARIDRCAAELGDRAGSGTVAGNLVAAMVEVFDSVALEVVSLVASRHELLARLRVNTPNGVPLLTEATAMIARYLAAERDRGRITTDADIDALAPMLIGTGHLLFAGRPGAPPDPAEVQRAVTAAVAGAVIEPPSSSGGRGGS